MKKIFTILIALSLITITTACAKENEAANSGFCSWDEVVEQGKGKEVSIYMWGGNEQVNQYMDGFVATRLKELYNIKLSRVPSQPPEYLKKLINEKTGNVTDGTADLLWINAENFRTARDAALLWGPFTDLLPNLNTYYDLEAGDLKYDSGVPIEGYEGIWGRAQLVLTYDSAIISDPPRTYAKLLEWVKKNPGKFTYPVLPDDFAGSAFVRTAYFEIAGQNDIFQTDISREDFEELSGPVMKYFNEMESYLWQEGKTYPKTQSQLDELFKNGEVLMTLGFEIGKTSGQIEMGIYPDTVRTYVFESGTVGNSHYLAIPFNAPNKSSALLVINFLQSAEAQIEKLKPGVWGDMAAFDTVKLSDSQKKQLSGINWGTATLSMEELAKHRIADMQQKYIGWIEEIWVRDVGSH